MIDTLNAINGAKKLLKNRMIEFLYADKMLHSKYSSLYFWTNENINAYLSLIDFSDREKALTVLASGDQLFNLVFNGVKKIDTFDTNKLTEYYAFGIKRSMILTYSYQQFIKNMNKLALGNITSCEETYSIIESLFPIMDYKYKLFWKELISYDYTLRKNYNSSYNLLELLSFNDRENHTLLYNTYLFNKDNYDKTKNLLSDTDISFKCTNAINLDKKFKGNLYDVILLSNILDYFQYIFSDSWGYHYLKKYEQKLEKISNKDAVIFLKYVFYYKSVDDLSYPLTSTKLFRDSFFYVKDMEDEEIISFKKNRYNNAEDAIILKRVK